MKRLLLLLIISTSFLASAQVPTYVPTDGLVGWYPLDGNATDFGDNGVNGTESGTTGAVSRDGTTDGALEFNGSSHVNLGNSSVLNPAEMSVSCWFQIQSWNTQNGLSTILGRNLNNGSHRYGFNMGIFGPNNTAIGQTGLRFGFDDDSNSGNAIHDYNIPEPLNLNEWYHFGITMNLQEEELIFYLNGTVVSAENIPSAGVNPIDTDVLMGFYRPNGDHSLNGLLDDVGIWNRTLSDVEMTGIYSETPPLLGCVDANACNYDAEANTDDGSCAYGCLFCGAGTHWDAVTEMCIADGPGAVDENCTLMNLQDLAEGYQILLAENAELDSLLADCNGTASETASNGCADENSVMFDGHDYDLVEIGDQCWFAENLQTEHYANGDLLEGDLSDGEWSSITSGAQAVRNNDDSNLPSRGRLYNWAAVADTRGLCPSGWHIPTDSEWKTLELELGMPLSEVEASGERGSNEGQALKASPSDSPSWNGNNSSGFNAYPGGARDNNGGYYAGTSDSFMWTSTPFNENSAWIRDLDSDTSIERYNWSTRYGFSVRCVKD